jgi:hypothetical protein
MVDTPFTRLMYEYYGTLFPLWDESYHLKAVAAIDL